MKLIEYLQEKLEEIIIPNSKVLYILKGFSTVNLDPKVPKLGGLNHQTLIHCRNKKVDLSSLNGAYYLNYEEAGLSENITEVIQYLGYEVIIVNCNLYKNIYPTINGLIDPGSAEAFYADQYHCFQDIFSSIEENNGKWYVTYNPLSINSSFQMIDLLNLDQAAPIEVLEQDPDGYDLTPISDSTPTLAAFIDKLILQPHNKLNAETQSELSEQVSRLLGFLQQFFNFSVFISPPVTQFDSGVKTNPAFVEILQRRNKNYTFRDFKCYVEPNYSNETRDVNQETVIGTIVENAENALSGETFKDIFVTAPTGAGKSIMFQIPAIYLGEKYDDFLTIVISPLIGLMNDQVNNIEDITDLAATINSDYTPEMRISVLERIRSSQVKILYISPESFIMNSDIAAIIGNKKIGLLVVDEAHTVVTWGQSFRPNYWYLGERVKQLRKLGKMSFPIATFSATVPHGDIDNMYQDIIETLNLDTYGNEFIGKVRRDEISFDIRRCKSNSDYELEKNTQVQNSLDELMQSGKKTIAYFPYITTLKEIFNSVNQKNTNMYYGNLAAIAKNRATEEFRSGEKKLLLATKAFGMGIDVPDVDCVYHFAPTGILSDYVQEIGRAARMEGAFGVAQTDYFKEDFKFMRQLYGMSRIREYHIKGVLRKIHDHYKKHNKRNFTLSPEVFAHVFAKKSISEVETSLKTTLLMIEKDFEMGNYGYKPLVFRPKTFFTRGYVIVDDHDIEELRTSIFHKYFTVFRTKAEMGYKVKHGEVFYIGDLFQVDFKNMWEDHFRNLSFADFKRRFYEGELDGFAASQKYIPHYLLHVEWIFDSSDLLLHSIDDQLLLLAETFVSLGKNNKFFNATDFETQIKMLATQKGINFGLPLDYEGVLRKFVTILNSFPSYGLNSSKIITERGDTFFIKQPARIRKTFETLMRSFHYDYGNVVGNRKSFVINARQHKNDLMVGNLQFVGAQILEILGLAEYSILSGERPEFFLRVNNIDAIKAILFDENYRSPMVGIISQRHEEGVKIMRHFFENIDGDKERWDFIENYFNGLLTLEDYS